MQNLNNQLIGKDKYITVVPNDRSYLIEDYVDLNGCFVFATKNTSYSLTEQISQDYYSFQNYQGNNYIKFADGFPINDYVRFKIIKPEELLSIPFKFSTISSITPDALNKNFNELKRVCLLLQEITNNRTMRLDTTDGQVMLPELKPLQTWLKDVTGDYKAISLNDFKELGESLILDYYKYIQQLMNATFNNARDNITTVKNSSILEMQNFLKNFLAETTAFTESQKAVLQKIVDDFKIFVNTTEIGNAKLLGGFSADELLKTEHSLESLKKSIKYKAGDVIKVLGGASFGDGLQHLRVITNSNTNNGVQTASGLWANLIPNSQDSEKQDKVDNRLTTASKNVVEAINEIDCKKLNKTGGIATGNLIIETGNYPAFWVNNTNATNTDKSQAFFELTQNGVVNIGIRNKDVAGQGQKLLSWNTESEGEIFNTGNCPFSRNDRGWQKFQSGLIMQWGYQQRGSGQFSFNFPIAFTHPLSITTCNWNGDYTKSYTAITVQDLTNTGATFFHNDNFGAYWIAIGH